MPATALASSPERRSFPVPPPAERKDPGNSDGAIRGSTKLGNKTLTELVEHVGVYPASPALFMNTSHVMYSGSHRLSSAPSVAVLANVYARI